MAQNGKGSTRRKGEDNRKFRDNYKSKTQFVPQWKKDLEKLRTKNAQEK